jgi:20S proteasome subunit beta 6
MKMALNKWLLSLLAILITQDNQHTNPSLSHSSSSLFSHAQKFEPYALNGGLVSAVAGRDYVLLASDTRLTDGSGYEIHSRNHLSSRLWDCGNQAASSFALKKEGLLNQDGSVSFPSRDASSLNGNDECAVVHIPKAPTFVSSAGCASDCEALKRQVRSELQAHVWNAGGKTLHCSGIANVLGQTLYARRGFPFYSFCLLAGMQDVEGAKGQPSSQGLVHVYDAIGSFERVAVASTGSGKEMLQPILDRLFSSKRALASVGSDVDSTVLVRDGNAIEASQQRVGQSMKLSPPVQTCVDCSAQDAIGLLVKGYRAVSEREIGVGDFVVLLLVQRCQGEEKENELQKEGYNVKVMRFPLKKH